MGTVLVGCGNAGTATNNTAVNNQTSQKPVMGGNLNLDFSNAQQSIDPAIAYDTSSDELVDQMYDRLLTYQGSTNNLVPMAATAMPTVSSDGLTYTFHIRKGMTFWNGDPVTAQSFVDEIQRVDSQSVGSPGVTFIQGVIVGANEYYNNKAKTISGIKTPDKYTLVIKLKQPEPFFPMVMAMPFFSAVDQTWVNKVGNKSFGIDKPMGSGPFELQSASPTKVVLKKNPHYWMTDQYGNHYPYLNTVTFNIDQNLHLDAMNFEQGSTAWMGPWNCAIPSSDFPHFKTDPTLSKELQHITQVATYYLGLNTRMAPFNNVKVRQAVEYAIDKKRIIQIFNGRGIVANQPVPPGLTGYVQNLPSDVNYTYNPTKAKQLLQQAGIKSGTTITIEQYNDPEEMKETQVIQQNLQSVGFNVNLKTVTWGQFVKSSNLGQLAVFPSGWNEDFPDAYDFLMLFTTQQIPQGTQMNNNDSMYSNKQVDQWVSQIQHSTDPTARNKLIEKATVQIMKDAPWVPIYYPVVYYISQPWVHNFYLNNNVEDPIYQVWVDKSHANG